MAPPPTRLETFQVPAGLHGFASLVHRTPRFWRWLGNVETRILRDRLAEIDVHSPIFIAGLARSGTTMLLEIVAAHADVATHQYRDFPLLCIPYWWNTFLDRYAGRDFQPEERAHGDGILVTPRSPEAMEEPLWMQFLPGLHASGGSDVLDGVTSADAFARFYRDHVRKLLLARGRRRYASKGNYNLTRLEYLLTLFPDARMVVPVRAPRSHVASLRKQHALFCDAADAYPRSVAHLDQVGHYEFGRHRRAINAGDAEAVRSIEALWATGDEVRGWARYWAHMYGYVSDRLASSGALREATLLVRYEELCGEPEAQLRRLLEHCALSPGDEVIARFRDRLRAPSYYQPQFTDEEEAAIAEETAEVARRFGYDADQKD